MCMQGAPTLGGARDRLWSGFTGRWDQLCFTLDKGSQLWLVGFIQVRVMAIGGGSEEIMLDLAMKQCRL